MRFRQRWVALPILPRSHFRTHPGLALAVQSFVSVCRRRSLYVQMTFLCRLKSLCIRAYADANCDAGWCEGNTFSFWIRFSSLVSVSLFIGTCICICTENGFSFEPRSRVWINCVCTCVCVRKWRMEIYFLYTQQRCTIFAANIFIFVCLKKFACWGLVLRFAGALEKIDGVYSIYVLNLDNRCYRRSARDQSELYRIDVLVNWFDWFASKWVRFNI